MRFLLDTSVLLRSIRQSASLPRDVVSAIVDDRNVVIFSVVNIWEIGLKSALRRADFDVDPRLILRSARIDFEEAMVTSADVLRATALPLHHRDPFDRLLVAQAIERDATLLTTDRLLLLYGDHVRLIA